MLKTAKPNPRSRQRAFASLPRAIAENSSGTCGERPQNAWTTLLLGLAGSLLLWAAFPPINLPWLAWLAPVAWLSLASRRQLPGWRPYVVLWICGLAHWLLMLEGIRLAHPALYAGWFALAAYLGVYLPVFVGLVRAAVHRLQLPLVITAPILWVGLELLRGHLITGFSMGLLAHSQAEFPRLIQVADLAGGYTLSLVVMLVAACITQLIGWTNPNPEYSRSFGHRLVGAIVRWWPAALAASAVLLTLAYGQWRLSQTPPGISGPTAHVALIQGSLDTVFDVSAERLRETLDHYRELTEKAVAQRPNLDLVVWPESMFVVSETISEGAEPSGISARDLEARQDIFQAILAGEAKRANAATTTGDRGTMLLVGTTTVDYGHVEPRIYNAALLVDRMGGVAGRYYKTHPVMFGEYIPFGEALPWLYKLTPMAGGLSSGRGPAIFEVAGLQFAPSVCFESTIPHLIRSQVTQLARRGTPADVLVNVTNDGWFWGTGMLDLHFRCGVFRAVENRKPLLVVANTGISTFVDGGGLVRQRGPRRQPVVLFAAVQADGRRCVYQSLGDWPAWLCAAACMALGFVGWRKPLSQATVQDFAEKGQ